MLVTSKEIEALVWFLTEEQLEKLNTLLDSDYEVLTCKTIADVLNLSYSQAITLIVALDNRKKVEAVLMIYHSCSDEAVDMSKFGEGFPKTPYTCANCGEIIEDSNHLNYTMGIRR